MTKRLACFAATFALGAALVPPAQAAEKQEPDEPHWSDVLKDIALGPLRLDIGGSLRLRYEHQDDFNVQRYADARKSFRSDDFLLQRTRLEFTLRMPEEAEAFFQLQDARPYGSDFRPDDFNWRLYSCPYSNDIDLRQAYVEWRHIGGSPFGVKLGRQAISYADNRVWGPGEWGNVGRYTWDAVKLIADTPLAEIHGIFANRVRYDPHGLDESDGRLDAYGAYAMLKGLPFQLDLFWLAKHTRPRMVVDAAGATLDLDTHTAGFAVDGKLGRGWDYGTTLAGTFGRRNDQDVEAFGGHARLGYTFDHPWEPRIGAEYSHASGDPDPADGTFRTFDGAFGGVDTTKYGWMNFFCWMNVRDYEVTLSVRPVPKVKVSLEHHFFRLDEAKDAWYWSSGRPARRDATGNAGADVGQEMDLAVAYDYNKHLKFLAGYSHFFPGRFLRRTGASPDADWLFLQVVYSF
jgi:hypothetical protein